MGRATQIRRLRFPIVDAARVLCASLLLVAPFIPIRGAYAVTQSANQSSSNSQKSTLASGQISGHVYRADTGAPLAKAVVRLEGRSDEDGPDIMSIQTGPDGSFAFAGLPPGKYILKVQRCGFLAQSLTDGGPTTPEINVPFSLAAGQKLDGMDFRLIQGGVISGVVTDEDGEPVSGLLIKAMLYSYDPGGGRSESPSSTRIAHTDDRGYFRVVELNPGPYYVKVERDEPGVVLTGSILYRETFYPNTYSIRDAQQVRVEAGGEASGIHISVRLQRVYEIRGKVYGPCQGEPRYYCLLTAMSVDDPMREQPGRAGTDEKGAFTFGGFFSGEYQLRVNAFHSGTGGSLSGGSVRIRLVDRDVEADIAVAPLAEVYGIVTADSSRPFDPRQFKITLSPITSIENSGTEVITDDDSEEDSIGSNGRFNITDIHPGKYVFDIDENSNRESTHGSSQNGNSAGEDSSMMYLKEVNCGGRDYAKQPLDVSVGMRLGECKIKVARDAGSISGAVMDGDKPVVGLVVIAISESRELRQIPRFTMTSKSNRSGQFNIHGLIPGDYLLLAIPENEEQNYFALDFADKNQRDAVRVTVKPNETKTLNLKPATPQ